MPQRKTRPRHRLRLIGLAIMGCVLAPPGAIAQNIPCGDLRCNLPPNLAEQLVARYRIDLKMLYGGRPVSCSMDVVPAGGSPICSLTIRGPLQPPPHAEGATPLERARSISRAILDRDAALFGIADPVEIRETGQRGLPGKVFSISYARFIGDVRMAFTHFTFAFQGDGTTLYHLLVSLSPAPPALYEAAKRERLSADAITAIVARDLGWPAEPTPSEEAGGPARPPSLRLTQAQIKEMLEHRPAATPVPEGRREVSEPKLHGFGDPPYVRWYVNGKGQDGERWYYSIDALTGKILQKSDPTRDRFTAWLGSPSMSPAPGTSSLASPQPAAPPPAESPSTKPPPED